MERSDNKKGILKIALCIFILLTPPLFFGIINNTVAMGIILVPCTLCVFVINIRLFKRFRIGDIEAELQDALQEAHATVRQLQKVQTISSNAILQIIYGKRYIFMSDIEKNLVTINDLYANSNEIGVVKSELKNFKVAYIRLLGEALHEVASSANNKEISEKIKEIFQCKYDQLITVEGKYVPSLKALTKFLNSEEISINDGRLSNALRIYQNIIEAYEQRFGKLDTVDNII